MLMVTLKTTDKFEKSYHIDILKDTQKKDENNATYKTSLPRHAIKWMIIEKILIKFSIVWIAVSIALREYFLNR